MSFFAREKVAATMVAAGFGVEEKSSLFPPLAFYSLLNVMRVFGCGLFLFLFPFLVNLGLVCFP
jgi:hypothetical protein